MSKTGNNRLRLNDLVLITSDLRWQRGLVGEVVMVGAGNTYRVSFDRYESICTLSDFSDDHSEEDAEKLFAWTDPLTAGIERPFGAHELQLIP